MPPPQRCNAWSLVVHDTSRRTMPHRSHLLTTETDRRPTGPPWHGCWCLHWLIFQNPTIFFENKWLRGECVFSELRIIKNKYLTGIFHFFGNKIGSRWCSDLDLQLSTSTERKKANKEHIFHSPMNDHSTVRYCCELEHMLVKNAEWYWKCNEFNVFFVRPPPVWICFPF